MDNMHRDTLKLIGKRLGKLTVLDIVPRNECKDRQKKYKCVCDCGRIRTVYSSNLTTGKSTSCGICVAIGRKGKSIRIDYSGQKYNRITILEFISIRKDRSALWLCECECGKKIKVPASRVKNGYIRSCGCLREEWRKSKECGKQSVTHGMSGTRMHRIWIGMLSRCYNPNRKKYKNYGALGVTVCDQWRNNFMQFYKDMKDSYDKHSELYGEDNTTIERIDVEGNYEPSNCKWETWINQAKNKRKL